MISVALYLRVMAQYVVGYVTPESHPVAEPIGPQIGCHLAAQQPLSVEWQ